MQQENAKSKQQADFPRHHRRGSIEADQVAIRPESFAPFRDIIVAAPLKRVLQAVCNRTG